MTWGTWLVAASLIAAPFWFNPLGFSLPKVRSDFKALNEVGGYWTEWTDGGLSLRLIPVHDLIRFHVSLTQTSVYLIFTAISISN